MSRSRHPTMAVLASVLPVVSVGRLRDVARSAFWVVPTLCVVASIGLGIGLVDVDLALPAGKSTFLFPGPPAGARSFLSSIVTAMISFTGLVFSITVVVLQLTSSQFSPRVLRMFLRDRTIQVTLGVFVATFVYALVIQRAVRGSTGHDGFVPRIAVTVAFVFVLASVGLFIRYIDHVANMIRAATIVAYLGDQSRATLDRRYPPDAPPPPPVAPPRAAVRVVPAPDAGVVVSVNEQALLELAIDAGRLLVVVPRVGDYLPAGAPMVTIHPGCHDGAEAADVPELERRIVGEVAMDSERTMEQDLAFGFRQLVDIAERALSPGVNDPTTAAQTIDVLHDLLRRLATRRLPTGRFTDPDGQLRLVVPPYDFADFLDLAVAEIWRYGADSAQIPGRITSMLTDLADAARPEHLPAVQRWMSRMPGAPIPFTPPSHRPPAGKEEQV